MSSQDPHSEVISGNSGLSLNRYNSRREASLTEVLSPHDLSCQVGCKMHKQPAIPRRFLGVKGIGCSSVPVSLRKLVHAIYRVFFSAVKIENFVGKKLTVLIFLLKTLIMDTC